MGEKGDEDDDKKDQEDAEKPGDKEDEEKGDTDEKEDEPEDKIEQKPETKLSKGNLIATIPKLKKEWRVSFDFKLKTRPDKEQNVIHLTASDKNCCKPGDRIPYIYAYKNQRIRVCSDKFGKGNQCIWSKSKLPLNKYVSVLVEQTKIKDKYSLTLTLGGERTGKRHQVGNDKNEPAEYDNVKIYAADKYYPAADGFIKNFLFANTDSSDLEEDEKDKEEETEEEGEDGNEDEKKEKEENKEKEEKEEEGGDEEPENEENEDNKTEEEQPVN